jgi:hypothetical protein
VLLSMVPKTFIRCWRLLVTRSSCSFDTVWLCPESK